MNGKSTLKKVANDYLTHKKTNKAITLIALVITIIVLLILTGVSVNMMMGDNGLINRAQQADDLYKQAQEDEEKTLEEIYATMLLAENWSEENNQLPIEPVDNEGVIGRVSNIKESGYSTINVTGKTSATAQEETVEYKVHTVVFTGNMILDGENTFDDIGITLTEEDGKKVYAVGDKTKDVATATVDASYTVVLKVVGNLTINEDVKLTACKSDAGYGGPKGMLIYCVGTLKNDGEISMTARGARANGQNLYLWENAEGSTLPFEFVPATGAGGGDAYTTGSKNTAIIGKTGKNGTDRRLGGGGSGGAIHGDEGGYAYIYEGGTATSYSGGTGSGAENENSGVGPTYGRAATNNGGSGGIGRVYRSYSSWAGRAAGGGTGNPGGSGAIHTGGSTSNEGNYDTLKGNDGTGGLLIIYADTFENNNIITADGVETREVSGYVMGGASGGGSINIFYNNINSRGFNITANGGASKSYGGAGGNGCVTIGNISSGSFKKETNQ